MARLYERRLHFLTNLYIKKPLHKKSTNQPIFLKEATEKDIEKAAMNDWGDEFLSKEEIKYYLGLENYK